MIAAGGGSIVNIGSNSWWENQGGFPAYTTAKSAVHGLTRTMARDLAGTGSASTQWCRADHDRAAERDVGKPGEAGGAPPAAMPSRPDRSGYVARMVMFLASDDSALCSSNNYMVEAGSI